MYIKCSECTECIEANNELLLNQILNQYFLLFFALGSAGEHLFVLYLKVQCLEFLRAGLEFVLFHLSAKQHRSCYFLSLSFLICKMGIILPPPIHR